MVEREHGIRIHKSTCENDVTKQPSRVTPSIDTDTNDSNILKSIVYIFHQTLEIYVNVYHF